MGRHICQEPSWPLQSVNAFNIQARYNYDPVVPPTSLGTGVMSLLETDTYPAASTALLGNNAKGMAATTSSRTDATALGRQIFTMSACWYNRGDNARVTRCCAMKAFAHEQHQYVWPSIIQRINTNRYPP